MWHVPYARLLRTTTEHSLPTRPLIQSSFPVIHKVGNVVITDGNVFTDVCQSVHNRPHGYSVTAHHCYSAVGTHPTGMLSRFCTAYVGKNEKFLVKEGTSSGVWTCNPQASVTSCVTLSCLPDWANLTLFVRLRLLRSLYSHALLILAKSSKSNSQLVHQQKWS